jgi:hypothetical protein
MAPILSYKIGARQEKFIKFFLLLYLYNMAPILPYPNFFVNRDFPYVASIPQPGESL